MQGVNDLQQEYLQYFFSSGRRHTMWNCDWSSDVCSSDLFHRQLRADGRVAGHLLRRDPPGDDQPLERMYVGAESAGRARVAASARSEERRVGRECRSRGVPDQQYNNAGRQRSAAGIPAVFFFKRKTAYDVEL